MRNHSVLSQPNYWKVKIDQRNLNNINLNFLELLLFTHKHICPHSCTHTHTHVLSLTYRWVLRPKSSAFFAKLCLNHTISFQQGNATQFVLVLSKWRTNGTHRSVEIQYTLTPRQSLQPDFAFWNCFTVFRSQSETLFGGFEDCLWRYFWGLQKVCNGNIMLEIPSAFMWPT